MQNEETTNIIPTQISWDNSDIDRAVKRRQLAGGVWHQFVVQKAEQAVVGANKRLTLKLTVAPVDGEGSPKTPTTQLTLFMPYGNPNVPGDKGPNTFGFLHKFCGALYPKKYGRFPKKDGNVWIDADGSTMYSTFEEMEAAKRALTTTIYQAGQLWWSEPSSLVGETFYGLTEDTDYRNVDIKSICAEPPPGAEVKRSSFADNS